MQSTLEKQVPDLGTLMAAAAAAPAPANNGRAPGRAPGAQGGVSQRWKRYRGVVEALAGKGYSRVAITEWFVEQGIVTDDRPKQGDWRVPPGEFWNAYQAFARMLREAARRVVPAADRAG